MTLWTKPIKTISWPTLAVGIVLGLAVPALYYTIGFVWWLIPAWLAALITCAVALRSLRSTLFFHFTRKDSYAFYLLLILFLILYFAYLYTVPYQMNTDEPTIMLFQKLYQHTHDIFGTSDYFGFASFIFIITGNLQRMLGGISLLHARMVHASMGLAIILLCYLFYRQFWKALPAFLAAVVVGTNHSLLGISRMAMRDNSALLTEALSLPFLFAGLKHKNYSHLFIGGALMGLSFYVYQPGRILIFIWLGFLVGLKILMWRKYSFQTLAKVAAASILGFMLVVLPLLVSEHKNLDDAAKAFSRQRFLFYQDGQQQQMEWVNAPTAKDGIIINIKNGLGTFNNRVNDLGYIYPNYGHGFVDPVGGILLWLGVLVVCWRIIRKGADEQDVLALTEFLGLWLIFAFVINKSPNYTRLLIILPFYAYFVVHGILQIANYVSVLSKEVVKHKSNSTARIIAIGLVGIIVIANVEIFAKFADVGVSRGDSVGSTARYIEQRRGSPDYQFFLASDKEYMYYNWGEDWMWTDWMRTFTTNQQVAMVIGPSVLTQVLPQDHSFTVFMNQALWLKNQEYFTDTYPDVVVHNMTTDGLLLAVEITGGAKPADSRDAGP